jgi:rfaE bifunctional protein kinase chain/domain
MNQDMYFTKTDIERLLRDFSTKNILVIGDVMLDEYITGSVNRISPEAPVPVVNLRQRSVSLGGASNVALNIKALGANPILLSVIGKDDKSVRFEQEMHRKGLSTEGIIGSSERICTTKCRVIGNTMQLLRIDDETTEELSAKDEEVLMEKFEHILCTQSIDAVIFEDYDKGVVTPRVIRKAVLAAREKSIPVLADPKERNFHHYRDITLFKPNLKEFTQGLALRKNGWQDADFSLAADRFMAGQNHQAMLITLSCEGMLACRRTADGAVEKTHIRAHVRNIADVSGAGDTVISVAALCLTAGLSIRQTAAVANIAGGLVCEDIGVAAVDKQKLSQEMQIHPIND